MFPIAFNVKITGDGFANKKALKQHMRVGMQATLLVWFQRFYDLHFERSAYARYGGVYTPRNVTDPENAPNDPNPRARPTRVRKRPNFQTGLMKLMLKSSFRISGTSKGAKLRMVGPWYTDIQGNNQPDKAAEITAMTIGERRELMRVLRNFIVRGINRSRKVRRIRIGRIK